MNDKQFQALMARVRDDLDRISKTKGREYSRADVDRLSNFKRHGAELKLSPEKVLLVYLSKHLDSITTAVNDLDAPTQPPLAEPIYGRILDAVLYLILLQGLFDDRYYETLVPVTKEAPRPSVRVGPDDTGVCDRE